MQQIGVFKSSDAHILTVREIQNRWHSSFQTAKCWRQSLSATIRAMKRGAHLIKIDRRVYVSASGKMVSDQIVKMLDELIGIEWNEIQKV